MESNISKITSFGTFILKKMMKILKTVILKAIAKLTLIKRHTTKLSELTNLRPKILPKILNQFQQTFNKKIQTFKMFWIQISNEVLIVPTKLMKKSMS